MIDTNFAIKEKYKCAKSPIVIICAANNEARIRSAYVSTQFSGYFEITIPAGTAGILAYNYIAVGQ